MKKKLFFLGLASIFMLAHQPLIKAQVSYQEEYAFRESGAVPGQAAGARGGLEESSKDKISLDIKGMDIVDVMKIFAGRTGMSIVVGKNVTGRVTLFLKDVPVWDAFEIVLLSNELAYEKKGDIINVMTQRDYETVYGASYQDKKKIKVIPLKYARAADLSRALSQIKTNVGRIVVDEGSNTVALIDTEEKIKDMEDFIAKTDLPLETRVFNLNYAQADKISAKIQESLTKGVGSLRADERTNKLAVTDYPAKLEELAKLIVAFDEKTPQVLIDAQVIEIKPSNKFQMGVDWDYWIRKNFRIAESLSAGLTNKISVGLAAGSLTQGKKDYKGVIDVLKTIGDTKILSSPRITALNNQEAKILVGTKEAYITSSTSLSNGTTVTSQTVNYVDSGIKLFVTPTINRDGFVTMKIRPEISSAERTSITSEDKKTEIPIVTTSEAETTVMVKDGITIIIGGLRKDSKTKTVKKLPWLGDIPVLGMLFRNVSDELTKTDLVILLTPHIISGEEPLTEMSEIKPKDGAIYRMIQGQIVGEKIKDTREVNKVRDSVTEYYNLIIDKIKAVAFQGYKQKEEKGRVILSFALNQDGSLIIPSLQALSAENTLLVPLALEAVKKASPFPPFPDVFRKERETFKISLTYE